MNMNKALFLTNAAVVTVLFLGILLFVNLIATESSSRFDLTEERVFTLDPLSKELPSRFDDIVTVRYYVTPDLFPAHPSFKNLDENVVAKIQEYAAHAEGKMRVEILDPRSEAQKDIDQEVKDKMEAEGVAISSHTIIRDDKPYPKEFYSSIKLNYGDKAEVIDDVKDLGNLEYLFTRALRRLQIESVPKVGFYFSGDEKGFARDGNFSTLPDVLRQDYLVESVDLGASDPVPDDIEVLFVAAPDGVPDRHKFAIDQYLMNGRKVPVEEDNRRLDASGKEGAKEYQRAPGRVVFLMEVFDESRRVNKQQWNQPPLFSKIDSGLSEILAHYGVKVHQDLVLDLDQCGYGQIPVNEWVPGMGFRRRMKTVRWPRIILSKNENYAQDLPFVNTVDQIAFIDALSLAPAEPLPDRISFTPVVESSVKSWRMDFKDSPFIVGTQIEKIHEKPDRLQKEANPEGAQYVLAGLWEGSFKSFYAGKDVPPPVEDEEESAEKAESPAPEKTPPEIVEAVRRGRVLMKDGEVLDEEYEKAESRIVVIGDSQIFSDFIFKHRHKPNRTFLFNLIEWLTTEESLAKIKSKGFRPRPLEYDSDKKGMYIALLVLGLPLVVVAIGILILLWRHVDRVIWVKALQGGLPGQGGAPPASGGDNAETADREDASPGEGEAKPKAPPEHPGPASEEDERS